MICLQREIISSFDPVDIGSWWSLGVYLEAISAKLAAMPLTELSAMVPSGCLFRWGYQLLPANEEIANVFSGFV